MIQIQGGKNVEKKFNERRRFLQGIGAVGVLAAAESLLPAFARAGLLAQATATNGNAQMGQLSRNVIDLTIAETPFHVGNRTATAMTINGTVPGPIVRLREGQEVTLNVTNRLKEVTSIHWHGVLLPAEMDGVPGVSFGGIKPGTTFTYRFPVKQYGTYWYHSHSGGQEQAGVYAPLIFDPVEPDPIKFDREYVVMLSDWTSASMETMIGNLKKRPGYYNFQQRTMGEFFSDVAKYGWKPTLDNYMMWSRMRMDPTDLLDVTGDNYTYLMNGLAGRSGRVSHWACGDLRRYRRADRGSRLHHLR